MKIIKHGNLFESATTYEFECTKCGCIYTVEEPELKYSSENAFPRYRYTNCPECQNRIPTDYARIYTKIDSELTTDSHAYLNKVAADTKEQEVTPTPNTQYRWISWGRDSAYNKYYRCSCCQHEIMLDDMCDPELPSSCEHCGAKMKECEKE